ncbi:hypothetical protein [Aeromicrobium sp.]|uniref:hypothetical protein n=1 Tax=Aeromicrobium sp. TaxID=1871063 RepID=UPI002FC8A476
MHRVRLIAAAALLAILAACGGSDGGTKNGDKAEGPAKAAEPQSGQCVAKEVADGDDFAPDLRTVVPCSELHAYEIVAVVAIPDDMLAGTTDTEKLARRTELSQISGEDTELRKRLRTEVYSLCDEPFREATGLGQMKVVEKSAKDVDLRLPPGAASQWYNLSSPELWVKGTTQAVCSFRFAPPSEGDDVSPVTPIRSNNTNPAMSSYLTRKYPAELRSCWDTKTDKAASCSGTHDQELLWTIDMKAVYGKKFLEGADLADVNDADFTKLADACIDPYEESGGGLTQRIGMGFRFFSDVPTTSKTLPIICVLAARDGSRLEDVVAYSRF